MPVLRSLSHVVLPGMAVVDLAVGPQLISGGGATGTLTLHDIGADGLLGDGVPLGTVPGLSGDLVDMEVLTTPAGWRVVYGGIAGGGGSVTMVRGSTGSCT